MVIIDPRPGKAGGFYLYYAKGKTPTGLRHRQKKAPPKRGCTNQIPLTIKPYPMKKQRYDVRLETEEVHTNFFFEDSINLI
jgi:hypothetical protein